MRIERTGPGILTIHVEDKEDLYKAYMPFLENGGIFIQTNKEYNLGDDVFMLLAIIDEPEKLPIAGKVVWITPIGSQGNKRAGIGIQFSDQDNGQTKNKIENLLAGRLDSEKPTHTM
ncbi:MAG: PilZ domain-containing protein [Kangiella sp.]|jgi:type IV pilus assembly protein PilZ|uniref:Type IV pilus assembly PilZ n=1 Tax=Kangiella koreensis (strain DSM 16069 / JCM 12317 / KCTC 12182 / SW-125) TaxID=523791 RepID=C7RBH2_KANKD|nr:PilZ domain-containing protein [Kangiella koreensis]ACV26614.1 type IV pilus assembly PilZ [Kangiella koreensis DSM 16069]MCW8856443.1 PilZ domain-containing protein [Kangiella sp.]MCW9027853.1 PilZ domain-containing protein [Kangiella sp.]